MYILIKNNDRFVALRTSTSLVYTLEAFNQIKTKASIQVVRGTSVDLDLSSREIINFLVV